VWAKEVTRKHWSSFEFVHTTTYISLDFKSMDSSIMDLPIQSTIRKKLVDGGIVTRANLPNDKNMHLWDMVKEECGLHVGELSALLNFLFPVGT
jgi:hypothetical protein